MDYLPSAQGEDIVAGRHRADAADALGASLPGVKDRLATLATEIEAEFGDTQEFEFTVFNSKLYLLQTRIGKRTPRVALRIAVEQVREGRVLPREALARLDGIELGKLVRTRVASEAQEQLIGRGVPASLGVVAGGIALDSSAAEAMRARVQTRILVRQDASTDDIAGLVAATGLLTVDGGRTSHAAVVARQLGRVCVVGCPDLDIRLVQRRCAIGGRSLVEGDLISIDGETGAVYAGRVAVVSDAPTAWLSKVERWSASDTSGAPRR